MINEKYIRNYPVPMLFLSLIFLVKSLFLAFYVTPLWAVPDEIGHYSYARDLADGKGVPVLGRGGVIGQDVMGYLEKSNNAKPARNWISQHPPIYYVIASWPLKIGELVTNDNDILWRIPRIISALSGALLLLVLFNTLSVIGLDATKAAAVAASIGFIPMVTNLSSGTSHDVTLFLFCAIAINYFTRYIMDREIRCAYWCALWLSLAAGVKVMTPLALSVPMVAILLLELSLPKRVWLKHAVGISMTAFFVPLMWMIRNAVIFGKFLYTSETDRAVLPIPLNKSLADYIHLNNVFDDFSSRFYGMFLDVTPGSGSLLMEGDAAPRHFTMHMYTLAGFPLVAFSLVVLIASCICIWKMFDLYLKAFRLDDINLEKINLMAWLGSWAIVSLCKRLLLLLTIILSTSVVVLFFNLNAGGILTTAIVSASIFLGFMSLPLVLLINDGRDKLFIYGFIIFMVFGSILLIHVYHTYIILGEVRATQGRYLYPVIPLVLLSASIALIKMRVPSMLINISVVILACSELLAFICQVIPFYNGASS